MYARGNQVKKMIAGILLDFENVYGFNSYAMIHKCNA